MIVEDDPHSRELLSLRLEGLGCQVIAAETAAEALSLARTARPDLIVLDLKLSGGLLGEQFQGVQVLNELRNDPQTAQIPVVLHSIYLRYPSDAPAVLPVADGYLPKPFKVDDLRVLIERFRAVAPR